MIQHDALAAVVRLLQESAHITDEGCKVRCLLPAPVQQGIVAHGLLMLAARQLHVFGVQDHVQTVLGALLVQMQKITQTQGCLLYTSGAVGDSANDVGMLKAAGLSSCMANGTPDAKAAADRIIGDVREDGVAALIEELVF